MTAEHSKMQKENVHCGHHAVSATLKVPTNNINLPEEYTGKNRPTCGKNEQFYSPDELQNIPCEPTVVNRRPTVSIAH